MTQEGSRLKKMTERSADTREHYPWNMCDTDVLYAFQRDIQNELQCRVKDETYILVSMEHDDLFSFCAMYYRFVFRGTVTGNTVKYHHPLPIDDEELWVGREYQLRADQTKSGVLTEVFSIRPVERCITPFRSRVA